MKNLLLLLALVSFGFSALSQDERVWETADNPNGGSTFVNASVLYNGKLCQAVCSTNFVKLYMYNPDLSSWSFLTQISITQSASNIESRIIGDKLYMVIQTYSSYELLSYDFTAQQLVNMNASISVGSPTQFKVLAGSSLDDLYMIYVGNLTELWLAKFNTGNNTWNTYNYTSLVNSAGVSLNTGAIDFYKNATDLFVSVSGSANAVVRATVANPGAPAYYNAAGSNDGKIRYNGSFDPNDHVYFTGNTQTAPAVNYMHLGDGKIYQSALTTSDLNVVSTASPLFFSAPLGTVKTLNKVPFSFIFSNIGPSGSITPNAPVYMIGESHTGGGTDTIGGVLDDSGLSMGSFFHINLENQSQQHLAVTYKLNGANNYSTKVLNRKPFLGTNSQMTNTGLCVGHHNEIYPQFEIYDADVEKVRISSVYSINGVFTDLSVVPYVYSNAQNPAVTKFRIYGKPTSSASDQIIVVYTDGWSTIADTLNAITVSASAPNVSFIDSPLRLCSNENLIELESKVNIAGEGIFSINGQPLLSSTVNGIVQSQLTPNGTLGYYTNVDGCYVQAGVSFSFVNAGIASATTTPAGCGTTNGTATVSFTNGTSSNVQLEWSTGETAATISNLSPGAYYYLATDEFGCHSTGLASVEATGITVSETVTNVTCAGADNGSISVTASGSPTYSVLWSTGHSTNSISNLKPGNYEVTVNAENCHVTKSYTVSGPAAIAAEFSLVQPGCQLQNGLVNGTYSGGTGSLAFNWIGQSQTTEDLLNVGFGYYEVEVKDGNNCVDTFGVQLNDLFAPVFIDSVIPASCNSQSGAVFLQINPSTGGNPAYEYFWSNGNLAQNNFNLASGDYTVTVNAYSPDFSAICHSAKTYTVGTKAPIRQEICIVTVDLSTTTNLVVWEKVEENIHHYNIYRENAVAGNFMLIDTVHASGESVFNDVVASPTDRSWRYKISAVNECGVEGPLSIAHKTLHLNSITNTGNGSMNIYWDDYEGMAGTEYKVWRYTDQTGIWTALQPTVSFGTSFFNDANVPAGTTGLDYYVEMISPFMCTAEKAQDFNASRSNKDKAQFSPGEGTGDSSNGVDPSYLEGVKVYPNPASEKLMISQTGNETLLIEILGVNGASLNKFASSELVHQISVKELAGGVYFVKIQSGSTERTVKFIKQ